MADRALAEPASAHSQLADHVAGLRLRGRRPRRLHDRRGCCRDDRQVRGDGRRPGADGHDGDSGAGLDRRLRGRHRPRHVDVRRQSCSPMAPATWRRCRPAPRVCRHRSRRSRRRPTAAPTGWTTVACWSSGRRPPVCSWPTRSPARVAPSRSPRASRCACRVATRAATSSGGWTPPASSTSTTPRSTTSRGPATCHRRNWSERRRARISTSTCCSPTACASWDASVASPAASPRSPARCPTSWRWPTSR